MNYDLKNILSSKGTYIIEWTILLKSFLIPKGHYTKKDNLIELFGVIFELGEFSFYKESL